MAALNRTRIVQWLRLILPLVALAILSTLFLLGRKPEEAPAIPYARVEAEELAREPRMTQPRYAGVTADGAAITLSAVAATPQGAEASAGGAEGLRLTWRAPEGLAADLSAPEAVQSEGRLRLAGGVRMTLSTGWVLTAPEIEAALDSGAIAAPTGIAAAAPFGELHAGAMDLRRQGAGPDHVLNFTGGVRLLYQP